MRLFRSIKSRKTKKQSDRNPETNQALNQSTPPTDGKRLFHSLDENIKVIRESFGQSTDLIIRRLQIGTVDRIRLAIIFMDGLADANTIQDNIIEALKTDLKDYNLRAPQELIDRIEETSLSTADIDKVDQFSSIYVSILQGDSVILLEGSDIGLTTSTTGWEERKVDEPSVQTVVRGPREAFTENIRVNTSMVRRRIRDHNLWIETKKIGTKTQTTVSIMFLNGVVLPEIVEEVRSRIGEIDTDSILESGYIEEFIMDTSLTLFPTMYNTERPDVVAADLLEGRVAIFVDGTPFVLIVPSFFAQHLTAAEDHYMLGNLGIIRALRYVALIISLLAPSVYISLTTFHQETIPTTLLISLAEQREGVPFPAFIEAVLMELTFEIIREAGVRMPRTIGQAISIVGALVIGQAAVEAGFVSASMVIVVAITAIASFVIPSIVLSVPIRILRFGFMCLGASFGFVGIIIGVIALCLHLSSLRSFGVPYMTPLAPFILSDQKDTILRLPRTMMYTRPKLLSKKGDRRLK